MFDDTSGLIYVGDRDKGYEKLEDLVQSGLITLHLDQKAGAYIDLMCDLTRFNNQHNQQVLNISNGSHQQYYLRQHNHQQLHTNSNSLSSPNSHSTLVTVPSPSADGNRLNNFKLSSNSSTYSKIQQHSPNPSVSSLSRSSMVSKNYTLRLFLRRKSQSECKKMFLRT